MPFKRYTSTDVTANRFYQMPKFLFQGKLKRALSNDAKVLYSLLRDRHELSLKSHWVNDKNEVYLIFTREEMADLLGCSQPTLRKAISALKDANLMEEETRGLNRPNLIFLNYITDSSELSTPPSNPTPPEKTSEQKADEPQKNQDTSGEKKSFIQESTNKGIRNEENFHSGVKDPFTPDGKTFTPSDTDLNETDLSENNLIYLSPSFPEDPEKKRQMDTMEQTATEIKSPPAEYDSMADVVRDTVEYDVLIAKGIPRERLDEIVGLMTDVLMSRAETIRVNRQDVPCSVIKRRLLKLSAEHIEYVIEQVENQTGKIKNIRQYLITSLYNAASTYENYIAQKFTESEDRLAARREEQIETFF